MISFAKVSKRKKAPAMGDLATRALRALRRAQRGVVEENRRLGLPLIVSENGKVKKIPLK